MPRGYWHTGLQVRNLSLIWKRRGRGSLKDREKVILNDLSLDFPGTCILWDIGDQISFALGSRWSFSDFRTFGSREGRCFCYQGLNATTDSIIVNTLATHRRKATQSRSLFTLRNLGYSSLRKPAHFSYHPIQYRFRRARWWLASTFTYCSWNTYLCCYITTSG